MSSEHARIDALKRVFARTQSQAVQTGIGDDCAVLRGTHKPSVWTVDSAVEHVHFRRDFMALHAIGYRAFMAATSDSAAMGARATAALSSLILPSSLSDAELDELVQGIASAAEACECPVVGGNLARGSELSITTSVLGEPYHVALLRSGARPGDGIFVTGPLGGAALGLRALQSGAADTSLSPFIQAFLSPRARLDIAQLLSECATSAIDLSDGLVQDSGHVARASGVRLCIEIDSVPRLPDLERGAHLLSEDPLRCMLSGGEDYEVLFTAPLASQTAGWATQIGIVEHGAPGVSVHDARGEVLSPDVGGFDHFR